jgi:probable F420-dependent oxidoreductase
LRHVSALLTYLTVGGSELDPLKIRIGVNLVMARPDAVVELARRAEACGYDSVWTGEHVALPVDTDFSRYGGNAPYTPRSNFLEPLSLLAALSQVTTRVRLGTGVLIAPLRDPVILGRAVMTVDVLSGGRLDLGLGIGWNEPEFANVGASYAERGRRTDEMLDVLDALFTQDDPEFHGAFYSFGPIGFEPKPVQRPRPKTLIGGHSPAALRRAARFDGWYGSGNVDTIQPVLRQLDKEREATHRDGEPFEILVTDIGPPPTRDELMRLADAGVDEIVLIPWEGSGPRMGTITTDGARDLERYADSLGLTG